MFLPLPTDAVTLTHATPAPVPGDRTARHPAVPPALAALAEALVESVPVRLTTTSEVVGDPAGAAARRPVLVARPRTSHEVSQVVRAARAHGVPVAVLSGERDDEAEGAAPAGVDAPPDTDARELDGAVLVSTRSLTGVTVLPVLARAHVGAGVRWRDLLTATAHYGLVPAVLADAGLVGAGAGRGQGSGGGPGVGPGAARHVPDDARVTDVLAGRGVRAVSVVTGTGALRRVSPGDHADLVGSATTGGARGARGLVVAVELDLVERPAP